MLRRLTEAERALRDSEERLDLALWASDLGLWDWSLERGTTQYDDRYLAMLGYERGDLDGTFDGWAALVHPDDRGEALRRARAHLTGATELYESTHRIRTKDGRWRWICDRAKAVARDASGRPTRIVGTHRDVTHEKRLESELLHATKMEAMGRIAGGIAHDFNNLLTLILSGVAFAAESLDADAPARADLDMVRDAAQSAADLTRQLLLFSRRQPLERRDLSLNQVVADTERMLRRTVGSDVELRVQLAPEACHVHADATQLQQIILNLVANARDAMPRGGRVVVETARGESPPLREPARHHAPSWVRLTVSDDGEGMDASTLAHVFEPFFTTKQRGRGTGLGLATVYGTVRDSGGTVSVTSTRAEGTRFDVWLPEIAPPAERVETASPRATGTETVLVVDDEPLVLHCTARVLERHGFHVLRACGAAPALECARDASRRIDLLVSDVVMPVMNGASLAHAFARIRPNVPVLLVSGHADVELPAGTDVLPKPFTDAELASRVRNAIDAAAEAARAAS